MTSALVVWSNSTTKNDSHSQLLAPRVGVNQTFESGLLPMSLCRSLLNVAALLAGPGDVRDTATAQLRMLGAAADIFPLVPAAHALLRRARPRDDPREVLVPLLRRRRFSRTAVRPMHARRGRDEREPQLLAERLQDLQHMRCAVDVDRGIERRSDRVRIAQLLQLAHHAAAHSQDSVPIDLRSLRRALRQGYPGIEEYRLVALTRHESPDLL